MFASWKKICYQPRQHIKTQRQHLANKIYTVKAMIFPVVMYKCESWTIKKAECWGKDAFELCCWRIILRIPWTARRSSQSILKEINPQYSLEGLLLKLNLQYFGHLMQRADSLRKGLMLGKAERKRVLHIMRWLDSITSTQWTCIWANSGREWRAEEPGMLQRVGLQRVGRYLVTEQQQNVMINKQFLWGANSWTTHNR